MSSRLVEAYHAIKSSLMPQMQGTCGVFSFYYAARLVQQVGSSDKVRPIDPPKKRYELGAIHSIREMAKVLCGSAQGEILSGDEMVRLVMSYKYGAELYRGPAAGRAFFIAQQVSLGHPILIAYWFGSVGPITHGAKAGAHWSVIVDVDGDNYVVINPHDPKMTPDLKFPKDTMLISNSNVDTLSYARYWSKTRGAVTDLNAKTAHNDSTGIDSTTADAVNHDYDIGTGGRTQHLAGVVIAVS